MAVTGFPSPTSAGAAANVTVTAKDAYGNTDASYSGNVTLTSSDGQAVLPERLTLTSGVKAFAVTLKTAGAKTIVATDTGTGSINGTENVTVNAASATLLAVSGFPSPIGAGSSGNVTVTAQDPYGNTDSGYSGTVTLTSSDAQAVLPSGSGLTSGVKTFSVALRTSGAQSITATDSGTPSINGAQAAITVNYLAASTLALGFPSSISAGAASTLTVTAKDTYGNTVANYGGTVTFSTDSEAQCFQPTMHSRAGTPDTRISQLP